MKVIRILVGLILLLFTHFHGKAQTVNWNTLDNSRHVITAGVGWDYSVFYSLGYAHRLKTKVPIVLNSNFSVPVGENRLDDFKAKIGGQIVLLNSSNLKASIAINGIYRRYENPLVRLQNFGSEFKGIFGYYGPKWFLAGEVGFDKAIVTNFKHSEIFKEKIYSNVKDGWYVPATGGNFQYGIQTGYSFNKSDITLNLGRVITQDFKTPPMIPFYFRLGYNRRLD